MQYEEPTIVDLGPIWQYVYNSGFPPGGKEKEDVPVHIDKFTECSGASSGMTLGDCKEATGQTNG